MAEPLVLKTALATYGHTKALKDGTVKSDRVRFDFVDFGPTIIGAFRRMVRDLEYDVCEMSPTTYLTGRPFGKPFTAIPIFLTRHFHHGSMVANVSTGVRRPEDLEGKRFGCRAYTVTTCVWGRGILQTEYGVDLNKIEWVTDDEEHVTEWKSPPNATTAPEGKSLRDLINAGEIHAAFTGAAGIGRTGNPLNTWQMDPNVQGTWGKPQDNADIQPLIPDAENAQIEHFKRTGIWPFHAMPVIKDSLLQQHPWLAAELFRLFKESRDIYLSRLHREGPSSDSERETLETARIVGGDPLPYGIRANLPSLEAVTQWVYDQKLTPRKFAVEEIFVKETLNLE